MNTLKNILLTILSVIALIIGLGYLLPAEWSVERSVVIQETPEKIYPYIANLTTGWPQWNAFEADANKVTYTASGTEEGVGASRSWAIGSNSGSQTIVKADPQHGIEYVLDTVAGTFTRGKIELTPIEGGTIVCWVETGFTGNHPLTRWYSYLFVSMDTLTAGLFEKSLIALKKLAEG